GGGDGRGAGVVVGHRVVGERGPRRAQVDGLPTGVAHGGAGVPAVRAAGCRVDAAGRKHCLPVFRERRAWRGAVLGAGDRRVRGAVRPAAGRAAGAERRIFPVPPLPAAGTRLWSGGGAMTPFDRDTVRSFRFVRCEFDAGSGIARLVYAFDDGPELVETITVPGAPFELDAARAAAAEQ